MKRFLVALAVVLLFLIFFRLFAFCASMGLIPYLPALGLAPNHPRPLRGPQQQDNDMNTATEALNAVLIFSLVLFFWVIA